jgi:hypothetical protein
LARSYEERKQITAPHEQQQQQDEAIVCVTTQHEDWWKQITAPQPRRLAEADYCAAATKTSGSRLLRCTKNTGSRLLRRRQHEERKQIAAPHKDDGTQITATGEGILLPIDATDCDRMHKKTRRSFGTVAHEETTKR